MDKYLKFKLKNAIETQNIPYLTKFLIEHDIDNRF